MRALLLGCGALALVALDACSRGEGERPAAVSAPPLITIRGRRENVGFDATVKLEVTLSGPAASQRWRFRWSQLFGPRPRAWNAQGASVELLTPPPPPRERVLAARAHGVVALSAAEAGRIVLQVEAEEETTGRRAAQVVEVLPAYPSAGWPRAALQVPFYLAGPTRPERNAGWSAPGSVEIVPTRVDYLALARLSANEWVTLRAPDGGELKLRGGVWLGDRDCGRFDCHPVEHRGWQRTAHASVLERGLSGALTRVEGGRPEPYQEHCLACHSVGHQPGVGVQNDGFDDRAREQRWFFPRRLTPRAWRELPAPLKERANVQCESCHGPGWFYVSYGDDVCAQCHDLPPRYPLVAQARTNRMREAQRSLERQRLDREGAACRGCHLGSEALRSFRGHASGSKPGSELATAAVGVTCAVCHDPHEKDCRRQLRVCGEVEIPGRTFDAGQGALCIACHSGEVNVVLGPLHRPFLPGQKRAGGGGHGQPAGAKEREREAAPHAPQFQLLTGRGGKFLRLPSAGEAATAPRPVYPHSGVPDSCVGCHYDADARRAPAGGHSFKLLDRPDTRPLVLCTARPAELEPIRTSSRTGACARCHGRLGTLNARARGDYDGDGRLEGIVDEVAGLLELLRAGLARELARLALRGEGGALAASVVVVDERLVLGDAACKPLAGRGRGGGTLTLPESALLVEKAAFNYLMAVRDGSGGIHNPQYLVALLQSTIVELERARGEARRHAWRSLP
jgi:hypothetical protein